MKQAVATIEDGIRICHITSMHDWDDDRIYQRACIGLVNEGLAVDLIATRSGNMPEKSKVQFHWLKKRSGIRRRIFSSKEAYKKAININANIFHFHDPDLLPWMLLLSIKGKCVVYDVHENYIERVFALKYPQSIKKMLGKIWHLFERYCGSKYAGIITTTESMLKLFQSISTPQIAIINSPYLLSLGISTDNEEKKPYSIYTSGTHSNKRNCIQTIEALSLIQKSIPQARLVFAGKYDPPDFKYRLISKARELGIEEFVEIEGMLPWRDNFRRTSRMEVGCVFYEDNANNRVTLPNRLFEYMVAGVAVLGESFYEVRKVIEESHCGEIVNSSDPNSIADGIKRIFSNNQDLKLMQKNAKRRVKSEYAYEHQLVKLIDFYKGIVRLSN